MTEKSNSFHKSVLVRPFQMRETEGLQGGTNQNVTNRPVPSDLLYSIVSLLRVGMNLQYHLQF